MSLATFSTYPKIYTHLEEGDTSDNVVKALMDVGYGYGDTNVADGLKAIRQKVFNEENGDREDVQNVVIVIMDGVSLSKGII